MNTTFFQLYDLNNLSRLFIVTILFISSFVIAEHHVPLDLSLSLDTGNVDTILDRDDWREPVEEESNWRKKPSQEKYTWGSISIYEDNKQLDPILQDESVPGTIIDERKAAPKFQLRF